MLDEVEEGRLRPLEVVEHDDERPALREHLEEPPRRPEDLLRAGSARFAEPDRASASTSAIDSALGRPPARPRARRAAPRAVAARVARQVADQLAERPVGDALAVGEAAAAEHRRLVSEPARELVHEPRLPHARRAEHGHEVAAASRSPRPRTRPRARPAAGRGPRAATRGRASAPRRGRSPATTKASARRRPRAARDRSRPTRARASCVDLSTTISSGPASSSRRFAAFTAAPAGEPAERRPAMTSPVAMPTWAASSDLEGGRELRGQRRAASGAARRAGAHRADARRPRAAAARRRRPSARRPGSPRRWRRDVRAPCARAASAWELTPPARLRVELLAPAPASTDADEQPPSRSCGSRAGRRQAGGAGRALRAQLEDALGARRGRAARAAEIDQLRAGRDAVVHDLRWWPARAASCRRPRAPCSRAARLSAGPK